MPAAWRSCRTPTLPGEVRIAEATEVSEGLVAAMAALVGQLSRSSPTPSAEEVQEIVGSPACHLLLATDDDGTIIGMLTLAVFRIPTGLRAWIEDVVVDEAARGRGVGAALTNAAIRLANERGARTVDLTSRPAREAANRLYQRLGFVLRETNVYRFEGPGSPG
jgi:ribosomal protein S18 acetylase RimI-like enzyme